MKDHRDVHIITEALTVDEKHPVNSLRSELNWGFHRLASLSGG
jgi:hypothetical protein